METILPDFNKMRSDEVVKFLHLPQKRKCMSCKGKKEKNGNAFWCNSCLETKSTYKK